MAALRRVVTGVVAAAVAAAPVALASGPASATTVTIASWRLDEAPGSTVAHDSSGNGYDGTIGTQVETGLSGYSKTAYFFTPPSGDVSDQQRIVRVPDAPGLDPGSHAFHVSLRLRTVYSGDFNVLQKGQATATGGFWKVQVDSGYPSCVMRGLNSSGGYTSVGLKWPKKVNDGSWHHLTCDKYAGSVRFSVDGATALVADKAIGHIDNSWAIVMGGKVACDPSSGSVDCDYYHGRLDSVVLSRSG